MARQGIHSRGNVAVDDRPFQRIGHSPAEKLLLDDVGEFVRRSREWREDLMAGRIPAGTKGPVSEAERIEAQEKVKLTTQAESAEAPA